MASSNRHWPSMFKSKPTCNTRIHHQWQSNDCHRSPYTSGCEERSPEPKPRWNPKPEQIRILESIFNSGMVNPPREEIRKIRAQLQEYGQVGDANVFYWFQNRKSRSKHKTRHLQKPQNHHNTPTTKLTTTTSSSSSSERSYSKSFDFHFNNNSPTGSVNQHFGAGVGGGGGGYHQIEFSNDQPFYFPSVQQPPPHAPTLAPTTTSSGGYTELGFCFSEFGNHNENVGSGNGMLLTDLMMMNQQSVAQKMNVCKDVDEKNHVKVERYNVVVPPPFSTTVASNPSTTSVVSTISDDIQGVVDPMPGKSTVFINDVAFEVAVGPFNVREAFGDDAMLMHSYGQPVVTNEWGVTLQSLQHGAFYYLVRSFSSSYGQSNTIDLENGVHNHTTDFKQLQI